MTDSQYIPPLAPVHWLTVTGDSVRLELVLIPSHPGAYRAVLHADSEAALSPEVLAVHRLVQELGQAPTADQAAQLRQGCRAVWPAGDLIADAVLEWLGRAVRGDRAGR